MTQNEIITALDLLGKKLLSISQDDPLLEKARIENQWFTIESQLNAIRYWGGQLNTKNLNDWLLNYTYTTSPKKVGVVMAGNIPMVGLHDLISIIVSGHIAMVKPSSEDTVLIRRFIEYLYSLNPKFKKRIEIIDKLNTCEALIATGSNNTARYFEYYFSAVPRIIRKNRNSIAVLTGKETKEDLLGLADDIFLYFGLGCRSVSKLLVPENYNFNTFFEAIEPYNTYVNHNKFYNNYTYHKAIFLMNIEKHLDNGFLLLKEDNKLASPLGCLFYSFYKDHNDVIEYIDRNKESIQVVIGNTDFINECVPYGQSQNPKLTDYADDVDTLEFLNRP